MKIGQELEREISIIISMIMMVLKEGKRMKKSSSSSSPSDHSFGDYHHNEYENEHEVVFDP